MSRDESPFSRQGPKAFQAVAARAATVALALADHGCDAAITLLENLASSMESDIEALYRCQFIQIRLEVDGVPVDFNAFFDRFVQEGWIKAAPPLRRLMLAYLANIAGGEGAMPWHLNGQSLQALCALALLDPDCLDVYRLYIEKGDHYHDHGPYDLYAEFLDRHGLRSEVDVRFGVFLTMKGWDDLRVDPTSFLEGAAQLVTPERFTELVMEEAVVWDKFYWDNYSREYIDYIGRADTPFASKVANALDLTISGRARLLRAIQHRLAR